MNGTPQAEQKPKVAVSGDFGLRPGIAVEVLTMENKLSFVGRVESVHGGAVVIREAKGDELPPVMYNKEVKLRYFRDTGNVLLRGKICGSTDLIWKVDRLESTFAKDQRAFFRQRISPHASAKCFRRSARGVVAREGYPCEVVDVSAGGLLIVSQEVYQEGDRLIVGGARLVAGMDPFSFECKVRRVGTPDMGAIRYGCQFESLPMKEQDRLLRAIFTVQREEIRNQKGRRGL